MILKFMAFRSRVKCTNHIIFSLTFISADRQNFEETKSKSRNPR